MPIRAPLVAPSESARRVRAAIAYSGLDHEEVAERTYIHAGTIRRIASRTKPRPATIEELWAIADACNVPRAFMEHGFQ